MTASRSLPRAVISLAALRASATAAVRAGGEIADLRADAFGHGVREVARIAHESGVSRMLVDDVDVVGVLRGEGIVAVTDAVADIGPEVLYGLPGAPTEPALSLHGRILSVKALRAGEAVSYGYTHRAEADTMIALVTGGYAQGIVRALGNRARVGIGSALRPVVGRVAMDVCVVDLQEAQTDCAPGQDVVYFGAGPAASELENWMQITGMRATELVTVAASRSVREWIS